MFMYSQVTGEILTIKIIKGKKTPYFCDNTKGMRKNVDYEKNFFTEGVIKHLRRFPVDSLFLEVFKK